MTDENKIRTIIFNSKEFVSKDDIIEAIRDVCNILEDPYANYVFNRLLEKINNNKNILEEEFE